MRKTLRYPLMAAMAAAISVSGVTPALAASHHLAARTCCDPGGAAASADAEFTTRYHVDVTNVKLDDLCPGDGDSVYVVLEVKPQGKSWRAVGRRENHSGCAGGATSETRWRWTSTAGRIDRIRLKVCVDETWPNGDDCKYSNVVTNTLA